MAHGRYQFSRIGGDIMCFASESCDGGAELN